MICGVTPAHFLFELCTMAVNSTARLLCRECGYATLVLIMAPTEVEGKRERWKRVNECSSTTCWFDSHLKPSHCFLFQLMIIIIERFADLLIAWELLKQFIYRRIWQRSQTLIISMVRSSTEKQESPSAKSGHYNNLRCINMSTAKQHGKLAASMLTFVAFTIWRKFIE